jgi:hypothetical protein
MEEIRAKLVEAESRLGVMEDAERAAGERRERRGAADGGGTRGDARARLFGDKGGSTGAARDSRGRKPLQLSPLANGARGRGGMGTERRPRSTGARGATRRERELEQTVEKVRCLFRLCFSSSLFSPLLSLLLFSFAAAERPLREAPHGAGDETERAQAEGHGCDAHVRRAATEPAAQDEARGRGNARRARRAGDRGQG